MAKAVFAALVSAVVGAAILASLGMYVTHALWPALGVGVLVGVIMRMCSHGVSGSYVNGALAALALLAAVVGGKCALVKVLNDPAQSGKALPKAIAPPLDIDNTTGEDATAGEVEPVPEEPEEDRTPAVAATSSPLSFGDVSAIDGLWLTISALIAYQIGKGEGRPSEEEEEAEAEGGEGDQQPAPETPQEQPQE